MNFAALLADAQAARKFNTRALAWHADLEYSYVCKLLKGGRLGPSREAVNALAKALSLDGYQHARLLVSAGYVPMTDPRFLEVVCQIAGNWVGGEAGGVTIGRR